MLRFIILVALSTLSFTSLTYASWKIETSDRYVAAVITGDITFGDRQRFVFFKSRCNSVNHIFSTYTTMKADFEKLKGKVVVIKFNGVKIGAQVISSGKFLAGHMLMFNLGTYSKNTLLKHLDKQSKITVEFVNGNEILADDYFDVPRNEWTISGISQAFENAQSTCLKGN